MPKAPINPALSPRAHQELAKLANRLCVETARSQESGTPPESVMAGGGQTRLGSIESLSNRFAGNGSQIDAARRLRDSLHIGVRQKRYTSIGFTERVECTSDEAVVFIHCEHRSRIAQRFVFRLKAKRPGSLTIGNPDTEEADVEYFD